MTKKDVCIIVPVYKENMDENERKSFMQCMNVLGSHDICLIAPEGLDIKTYMTARGGRDKSRILRMAVL